MFGILRVSTRFRSLRRRCSCSQRRATKRWSALVAFAFIWQGSFSRPSVTLFLLFAIRQKLCSAVAVCFRNVMFRVAIVQFAFLCGFAHATPVVDVKLSPAAAALPDVVAQIASLDAARAVVEEEALGRLDAAYAAAASSAESRIQSLFAKHVIPHSVSAKRVPASLLETRAAGADFRVEVLPAPSVSNRIRKRIALVERVRNVEESRLVDQAVGEFQMLVDLAVRELNARLSRASSRGASFLNKGPVVEPVAVDVRLLPPDGPFPTVAGLVAEMEERRDVVEGRLRQRVAELQLKLVKHMAAIVAQAVA